MVTLAPFLLVWLFPLVPLVPGAQDDEPAKVTLARHDRCTMNERLLAFLDAWALADERARAGAAELLLAARPRGAAAAARPDLSLLVDFARESATGVAVAGPFDLTTEERRAQVQALADQIDLVVTPGAFGARDESAADKGEPTTVHVRLFGSPRSHADVDLGLVWIGPDGRQVVARREPVSVSVLRDGVPMYVRPPASRPGPWRLVPELARKGAIARGVPVPVECVARVAARVAALEASASEEEGGTDAFLRRSLVDLLRRGARSSVAVEPSRMLAVVEDGGEPTWPLPIERAYGERNGVERWTWALRPSGELERALVLLGPVDELSDLMFAGETGARWQAVAERHRALLLSSALPPWDADVEAPAALARLFELARELGAPSDGELIAVARGDATSRLTFVAPDPPFDAAVLSAVVAVDQVETVYAGLPRLLVAPGGAEALPESAAELVWLRGSEIPLLNDAGLPELVGAWLDLRAKADAGRGR